MVSEAEGGGRSLRCGRVLVEGPRELRGIVVKVGHPLSFLGEVDPERGALYDGRSIKDKILIIKGVRGSTVGSYVIYALKYYGNAPKAIIIEGEADPIVVAGCVMADVPLVDRMGSLNVEDGKEAVIRFDGRNACLESVP